jgi:hypothetical protein
MTKHHLIISGTGRAGTTVLVQLLTDLGLDTGFADLSSGLFANCDAGMEWDIQHPDAPYIIKSPWLCDNLDEILQRGEAIIDHAIVPVRDLYSAAQSRRDVDQRSYGIRNRREVPGGLWHTDNPAEQEAALAGQLYKLIYAITKNEIPMTLLHFPRFIHDPEYLYRQIAFAVRNVSYDSFLQSFRRVVRPELTHNFSPDLATSIGSSGDEQTSIDES